MLAAINTSVAWLDVHEAEDRQRERDAVPEREGGDRPEQSPPFAHQQDEAEDEEQMVETR